MVKPIYNFPEDPSDDRATAEHWLASLPANYPEPDLADKVREAAHNLIAVGFIEPLYVDAAHGESGMRFFLNTAARYGTAGQE